MMRSPNWSSKILKEETVTSTNELTGGSDCLGVKYSAECQILAIF